jgi:hypothetical protein
MRVRIKGQSRFGTRRGVQGGLHFKQLIASEGDQSHMLTRFAP